MANHAGIAPTARDVNQEMFDALVFDMETRVHRSGWDQPGQFHAIYDMRQTFTSRLLCGMSDLGWGPQACAGDYRSRSMWPALEGSPVAHLRQFALALAALGPHSGRDTNVMFEVLRQPGIVGYASVTEAWGREYASLDDQAKDGDVRFADLPGSFETRQVVAVDLSGRTVCVSRRRGVCPALAVGDMSGRIVDALHLIVAVCHA